MGRVDWNIFESVESRRGRVASRMGRVDWNKDENVNDEGAIVASRMGRVDWNFKIWLREHCSQGRVPHGTRGLKSSDEEMDAIVGVASRMGRVDWNFHLMVVISQQIVASRMGRVDWNKKKSEILCQIMQSRPAWDAWIEILQRLL